MSSLRDPLVWIDCEVTSHPNPLLLLLLQIKPSWAEREQDCKRDSANQNMQMTGLNPDMDEIIQIYCFITNGDLELVDDDGWGIVVHQPKERLDQMDEWCKRTHGSSGLTAAVIESTVTAQQAASELFAYIHKHIPERRVAVLAGNSIHADRAFLRKGPYMSVLDHLHYRILDVSSLKEATRRWRPDVMARSPEKKGLHEAKQDILESIEEARYYKEAIFQATNQISSTREAGTQK